MNKLRLCFQDQKLRNKTNVFFLNQRSSNLKNLGPVFKIKDQVT